MVKSTEKWLRGEVTVPLDRPMAPRILIQGQMRSEFVVIAGVGRKDSTQMGVAEDDDMVEALTPPVPRACRLMSSSSSTACFCASLSPIPEWNGRARALVLGHSGGSVVGPTARDDTLQTQHFRPDRLYHGA